MTRRAVTHLVQCPPIVHHRELLVVEARKTEPTEDELLHGERYFSRVIEDGDFQPLETGLGTSGS